MFKVSTYKILAEIIYKHSGIHYTPNDFYRLDARFNSVIKEFSIENEDKLIEILNVKKDKAILEFFLNISTNNETYFFRDHKPFEALRKKIIPELIGRNILQTHIWSAGCSSGQEPYSILMSLLEMTPSVVDKISITATDISTSVLGKARMGQYTHLDVQRGLPAQLLIKYFTKDKTDNWTFNHPSKNKITFSEFNLLSGTFPVARYDLIFCRNVLIYQNQQNKIEILKGLIQALKPGGYLLMGSGESLIGTNLNLKQVNSEGSLYFQKEN